MMAFPLDFGEGCLFLALPQAPVFIFQLETRDWFPPPPRPCPSREAAPRAACPVGPAGL